MAQEAVISLAALDGLHLAATLAQAESPSGQAVVLVHGGSVTRDEGGFFARLAAGLAASGVTSLRFDLRGHGDSEGRQEDLTIAMVLNDIRVAIERVREEPGVRSVSLLGTSFGGGICAYYVAKRPAGVARLVLLNPQLDYKKRAVDDRPFWEGDRLTAEAAHELQEHGYLVFNPQLRHGRAHFNEVFWFDVAGALGEVQAPTLIVHGTADTLVPIDGTRANLARFRTQPHLVEIEGAQHGFAVDGDPTYQDPQSRTWQASVIRTVTEWIIAD
jgi:uncharacterized protein